ncbi:MAG: hypothetical protein M5R36_15450 [Deltaproteobacteria bacterium]|nr:hypothetical protein [Deltaproteobacteria bacterium]
MDHYGVLAPKCNINWPPFYWDAVELTGAYARVLKRTNEPKPAWNWTQSSKTDFEIFGRHLRCTTADEIRAQWYEVLAAGTKTMFWFFYRDEQIEECPEESTDIAPVLAAELEPLKDILLDGDVPAEGTIVSTEDELLHVTATVAPHGIAIFVVNIDYTLNLVEPWTWTERTDVVLNFTPPAGFEPMTFYWIENDQWTELTAANAELNTWAVFLPPFSVAQPILVVPEP